MLKRELIKLGYLEKNNLLLQQVDGFFDLAKDKEAIAEFLEEVETKTRHFRDEHTRLETLIAEGYYIDFYELYTRTEIDCVYEVLSQEAFSFQSFMAISKFYRDYALKTDDQKQYLETYQQRIAVVALTLANGDSSKAVEYAKAMIQQRYQPATPTFLNAGKQKRGEFVSCFLLQVEDSLNSINYNLATAMQLSKIGGGVAINLSKLRAQGEAIKQVENACKGVVPVMKLFEDAFNYADQMGQRKGAGAGYLNIFHWDVEAFLDTKKINADEKSRIQTLSVGLMIPDKFFELAKANEPFYVFAPLTVEKAFGESLDDFDIDTRYDELVAHPDVKKRALNARQLLTQIAQTQFESGYPYIVYKSQANRMHALDGIGEIKMSNLCTEIFQLQTPTIITDYGQSDEIGYDISCNLGSLNIVNVMESRLLEESVCSAVDALTAVSNQSMIANAPGVSKANTDFHAIGLGAMNLHGFLAKNQIPYESECAKEFAQSFFMAVNFYSIKRSMELAKEHGQRFAQFERSRYADGTYFKNYKQIDYRPISERVKQLFTGIELPGPKQWTDLCNDVMEHGLYHAYRLAIAPTQSIAYIQNATPSIAPVVEHVETRTYGNAITYYPMPYLSRDTYFAYKSAYHMDMMKVIDLIAVIQPHVDQGISTVLYVTNETSTRDLARLYVYAWHKGLKSLYYTRTKNLTIDDCLACSV